MKNIEFEYAVTHGGMAHRDDFISTCILFAKGIISLKRKFPTEEELENKKVLVFDVGGKYEIESNNFDHHQFETDEEPRCALTLLLQYFDLYDSFKLCYKWLNQTEKLDVKGPNFLSNELGCKAEDIYSIMGAIENPIINMFTEFKEIDSNMWIYKLMKKLGHAYINKANEFKEVYDHLEKSDDTKVYALNDMLDVLIYSPDFKYNIYQTLNEHVARLNPKNGYNIIAVIFKDDRGEGYKLLRLYDNPNIDFNLIEDKEGLKFVHKNGFVAVTKELDLNYALECCKNAMIVTSVKKYMDSINI